MVEVDVQNVDVLLNDETNEEILSQNLKMLFTTPLGSVPLDRDYGINMDVVDAPLPIARGRLIVEYEDKIRRFYPQLRIKEVTFTGNAHTGLLIPKVVITNADEFE
ncbi:hypothetical protein JCM19037_4577 [Geomicrobium sp. JCM 19037]|nr:hypothetical protein JCM19037_4577 [Geomicrobium sp. JCM 19037]